MAIFDINTVETVFVNETLSRNLKWFTMKLPTHLMTVQKFYTDLMIVLSPVVQGLVECTPEELEYCKQMYADAEQGVAFTQARLANVPRFYESAEDKGEHAAARRGLKNEVMTMARPAVVKPDPKKLSPIEQVAAKAEELQKELEKKVAEPFTDAEGKPVDQTKPLIETEKQPEAAGGRKKLAEGKPLTPSEKEAVAAEKKARKGIVSKGEAE